MPKRRTPPKSQLSDAEKRRRLEFVEGLMATGASVSMIAIIAREEAKEGPGGERRGGLGKGTTRALVEELVYEVREMWRAREEVLRTNAKTEQRERLRATLAKAVAAKNFNAAIGAERLLAELDGTLAPRRVEVDVSNVKRQAIVEIVAMLDDGELDRLEAERTELEGSAVRGREVRALNGHANGANGSSEPKG